MLKDRILNTLQFFDLQDYPLTLLELQKYLLPEDQELKKNLDEKYELANYPAKISARVSMGEILSCLEKDLPEQVESKEGFYCLAGRKNIIPLRLANYIFGLKREKLLKKYAGGLRHMPFVRGVALAGSQPLGQQKAESDIDLFIITDPKFLWLARTLVTTYFQVLGKRRHGLHIANRFCLNHYLGGVKILDNDRNLYTACEYAKLRPLVYGHMFWEFQDKNSSWMKIFFPQLNFLELEKDRPSELQKFLEKIFAGKLGAWLERQLKYWQLPRIQKQKFIVVEADELSFHPNNRKDRLFSSFFRRDKSNGAA